MDCEARYTGRTRAEMSQDRCADLDVRKRALVPLTRRGAAPRGEDAIKVFVLCDGQGEITSLFVPNPAVAANLGMDPPPSGRVHVVDVPMRREEVLEPATKEARQKVRASLREMIRARVD